MRDLVSVLPVDELEKRIGKVPGVECATVNIAKGNVAVHYDETRQVAVPLTEPTIFREVCHD